jgi:diguanylate cyclase (GGDEF)-like protein
VIVTARSFRSVSIVAVARWAVVPSTMIIVSLAAVAYAPAGVDQRSLVLGLASAATAVTGGAEILRRGWGDTSATVYRRWFGAAVIAWGLGQFFRCAVFTVDAGSPLTAVEGFAGVAAFGFAVAGILTIPRPASSSHPITRILLDSGLVTVVSGLLIWRLVFVRPAAPVLDASQATNAVALLAELMLCSMFVVTAIRDHKTHLVIIAAGVIGVVISDVMIYMSEPEALIPPLLVGRILWIATWPVITWCLLRLDPDQRAADDSSTAEIDPDAQATVVTTIVSLLLLGAGTGAIILQPPALPAPLRVDAVSWTLVCTAIGLLSARELLNAKMRTRLLGRLHEEAMSDPLTGLANHRMLTTRLSDVQVGELWCLIAIDLDGFKRVNDLLGHAIGDQLLCAVSNRLVRNLPRAALVSRTGGDEFAVLLPGGLQEGISAAETALTAVRRSCWDVEGVTRLPVTASVGVTALGGANPVIPSGPPDDSGDSLSALSAAGAALQLAKGGGRDRIEVFDATVALMRQRRLSVEERLRTAIRAGELNVRFQPIVDLRTGAISSVEALARWIDPRLGQIAPQEFIPVAEQTGLVVGLGEFVLHRTLDEATQYGLPERGIRVACNVSPLQLRVPGFPQLVEDALAAYSMPPRMLLVEVTEAVLVEEDGPGVQALQRLADVGVTIAIDDFGTGYSALGYLRRLPAHTLKIDRSLTSALIDEPQARAITRAVIDLGSNLEMAIVVEGIETSDVAELVTSMGAGYGQGTLYGSAMSMADVVRLSRRPLSTGRLV